MVSGIHLDLINHILIIILVINLVVSHAYPTHTPTLT